MKRITLDVPRWNIYLHRRERKLPRVSTRDSAMTCMQDEIFDRLYAGDSPLLSAPQVEKRFKKEMAMAATMHLLCDELGIADVATQCKGKAAEAALATQWLMETLAPQLKTQQQSQAQQGQQQDATHGLEQVDVTGNEGSGNGADEHEPYSPTDTQRIEQVADLIKDDERLKKIALLAGRFKHIVLTKQKSKVKHDSDELADIEQGGDLGRLLPSELVKFLSPRLRLSVKADLLERKCLQYSMTATERLGRGPVVLCVDKSGSMHGDKDIWATAIALALLDMAHRQKRTFILLGFDNEVFQKVVVRVGKQIPKEQLCVAPRGGTDICNVLDLALLATENKTVMHRADIILITDGESDTSQAEWIRERAKKNDVTILGIGIGTKPEMVSPWCDDAHVVTDMGGIDDATATALFGK